MNAPREEFWRRKVQTPQYRLWVNDDRTVMARLWMNGKLEVATRKTSAHIWGPPVTMVEGEGE